MGTAGTAASGGEECRAARHEWYRAHVAVAVTVAVAAMVAAAARVALALGLHRGRGVLRRGQPLHALGAAPARSKHGQLIPD